MAFVTTWEIGKRSRDCDPFHVVCLHNMQLMINANDFVLFPLQALRWAWWGSRPLCPR